MKEQDIRTTANEVFTHVKSVDMARLVYIRFGRDENSATAAWRRLLQNSTTIDQFMELVEYPEHTPNCDGMCRTREHNPNHG